MCDLLVLDDDELVRVTLGEALRDAGYVVAEAAGASEALAILRSEPECRLLVTDLHLAGPAGPPSGLRLAEQARGAHPELRVIYITGFPELLPRGGSGDRSIGKPFLPSELVDLVDQLIGEPR